MTVTTPHGKPPMKTSGEATQEQLALARAQGAALEKALRHMTQEEAHGEEKAAGQYLVGWAAEDAEGMYMFEGGKLVWHEPHDENAHLEVSVRDASDGRFVPGLDVTLTIFDANGNQVGSHQQPFIWHPWLYHYGRNWTLPGDGRFTLRVHIEPPTWHRHDKENGLRFADPVDVEFTNVRLETGQKLSG